MIQSSTEFIPGASIMKKNLHDYTPHASIMIKNMESSSKALPENIQELIDNSIDANSTECHISLRPTGKNKDFNSITIEDNGHGFASFEVFENGMHIGCADVEHKLNAIGKYTMGLKECCFSLANEIFICSKNKESEIFYCFMDLEKMKDRNSYNPTIVDKDTISNIDKYKELFPCNEDYDDFCKMQTGTLICLSKLKGVYDCGIEKQKEELEKSISFAYKYNTKILIFVNNNIVNFFDIMYEKPENEIKLEYVNNLPLRVYIEHNKFTVYMKMEIEMEIEKKNVRKPGWYCLNLSKVGEKRARNTSFLSNVMKIDQLPEGKHYKLNARVICINDDFFKKENEKMIFSSSKRCGVSTIRGDSRYVSHFKTIKDVKFDDYFNRFRMRISYESNELDTYFGIDRSKQQGSTMLSDDIPKMEKALWELTAKPYVNAKKEKQKKQTPTITVKTPANKVESPLTVKTPANKVESPLTVKTPVNKVEPPPANKVEPPLTVKTPANKVESPLTVKTPANKVEPPLTVKTPANKVESPPANKVESPLTVKTPANKVEPPLTVKTPANKVEPPPATKIPTRQITKEDYSDFTPPSTSSSSKTKPSTKSFLSRMPTFLQAEAPVTPKQSAKIKINEENTLLKFKLLEFETKYNNLLEERNEFETKYNNLLEEKKEWKEKEEKLLDKNN
jgi:hypothetical protein